MDFDATALQSIKGLAKARATEPNRSNCQVLQRNQPPVLLATTVVRYVALLCNFHVPVDAVAHSISRRSTTSDLKDDVTAVLGSPKGFDDDSINHVLKSGRRLDKPAVRCIPVCTRLHGPVMQNANGSCCTRAMNANERVGFFNFLLIKLNISALREVAELNARPHILDTMKIKKLEFREMHVRSDVCNTQSHQDPRQIFACDVFDVGEDPLLRQRRWCRLRL